MKVKDLIKRLGQMDQDAEVHFAYNYGDYWHTQVAPTVDTVSEGLVEHSAYHSMDKIVEDRDDADDEESVRQVVILG